jgi:metallophosphoesterase superfamily enzyme
VKDVSGAGQRLPVFLSTKAGVIMPAFSPFAAGYNLLDGLPEEFARLMGDEAPIAHVATGTRVVSVGPIASVIERMYQADVGKPAVFRRRFR